MHTTYLDSRQTDTILCNLPQYNPLYSILAMMTPEEQKEYFDAKLEVWRRCRAIKRAQTNN